MHRVSQSFWLSGFLAGITAMCGCGVAPSSTQNCNYTFAVTVSPVAGIADHLAPSPGNQVQFVGVGHATAPDSCAVPALSRLEYAAWTNPDPTDIQISSANDPTNGTALCKSATSAPVTLAGVFAPITAAGPAGAGSDTATQSVTLTCN